MKLYIASDGWPFFLQADGKLTDTINPSDCDLGWDCLQDLLDWDEDTREATLEEFNEYKNKV